MSSSSMNNMMAILLIASAAIVIGGLTVIPVIEAADAANAISESRNKGQRGELMSDGKRQVMVAEAATQALDNRLT